MHFGLRGRQEHHDMNVEDLTIQKGDKRIELLTFAEEPTKTRQGGLRLKQRKVTPKMFATGQVKCLVSLFKTYLSRRSEI